MRAKILTKAGIKEVALNRRRAIKFMCLDCSGFQYNEVRYCEYGDCFLYLFRTGKEKQDPAKRKRAIRAYCTDCMAGLVYEIKRCVSVNCPLFNFRGVRSMEKGVNFSKKHHIEGISEMIPSW